MPARSLTSLAVAGALALAALPLGPAGAADKPVLSVLTYSGFPSEYGPGALVKERFEKQCDCVLEWVTTDDSATMLARLKLEGAASKIDVVLGLDTNLMADAEASGLFRPHGVDASGLTLPIAWTNETFLPFDWGWFAFVYDTDKLKTPPKSLAELVDAESGPTILIEDPRTSTPGLGLLLWMREVYGEGADEAWKKLKPKVVTVTKGWTEAYGMFLEGEADMVLSYTTSPAYHIIAEGDDTKAAARFDEGHYLQVEVASIVASTDQPELARQFMAFLASDAAQAILPETNWMYPAVTPESGLAEGFQGLIRPEPSLLLSADEALALRDPALAEWREALAQ